MATLIINSSSSKCSDCQRGANPSEDSHQTIFEYGPETGSQGCGAVWDHVSVPYINGSETGPEMIHRLKYSWGFAKNVPDENWSVFGMDNFRFMGV